MAVTTNYSWFFDLPTGYLNNLFTIGGQGHPDVAANFGRTAYFGIWDDASFGSQVEGRIIRTDQTPVTDEFTVNSTNNTGAQFNPDVAGLRGGNFITVYVDLNADPSGDLRGKIFTPGGTVVVADFGVSTGAAADGDPDVCALADGGFAVAYKTGGSAGIDARVFNANGTERPVGPIQVVASGQPIQAAVAGLTGGAFVVLYDSFDTGEVFFRRFTPAGAAIDATPVLVDTAGVNKDSSVVALADGGFAVAYASDGWGFGSSEITFRIFNADGTGRTPASGILVNSTALGGFESGEQRLPTITTLGTGHIVVGWRDNTSGSSYAQVFDAAGNAVGTNRLMEFATNQLKFAGLSGAFMAEVLESTTEDGPGNLNSIRTNVGEFVRFLTSDNASDTLVGINDGLREVYLGLGGDDIFIGGTGPDQFTGGTGIDTASYATAATGVFASLTRRDLNTGDAAGDSYASIENLTGSAFNDTLEGSRVVNNIIDGGAGDDTAVYSQTLDQYIVEDFGSKIIVAGPDGIDRVISIEHLRFADTTLTPIDDGNPLFDRLFYLSRNADVFKADTTAFAHFNAFGWHEGRDPNPFFDTSAYLAVNKDVAASGVNPLDQYHQTGWKQGRDPGPNFDTTLYLIHNPDVAAAGVDPLAHYLQSGVAEGRQAYRAVGSNIVGGFDAQYYLFRNPDVAAAGVDPLTHFNTNGWHEGRNPNANFDTAGYLSHYADVAAAGVNPLAHYEAFGWKEGRDPSAGFDTRGYLAANPDVAAAHVNPLDHYLNFGIYEGRTPVNDGLWS